MIEAIELTSARAGRGQGRRPRRGGRRTMVDRVSFDVYPGQVTALLGPQGSGKSAVLRLMAELEPGKGRTLFGGRPYHALRPAVREVGLALEADALHPGRTVNSHLGLYASAGGVPKVRIGEVLEVAGLTAQGEVRCGRLDAGQRRRLSIAAALLGDPATLIVDEPHGLDTHGLSWFNALLRAYAAQGRTVLVAASRPADVATTADHVIVLRRDDEDGLGRVIASRSAAEVFDARRATVVVVRSPQATRLATALEAEGATLASAGPGALEVRGLDRARIGEVAHVAGICLHELAELPPDDSDDFLAGIVVQRELVPGIPDPASEAEAAAWRAGVRVVRVEGNGGDDGAATSGAMEIADAEIVESDEAEAEAPVSITSTVGWPAARAKNLADELAKAAAQARAAAAVSTVGVTVLAVEAEEVMAPAAAASAKSADAAAEVAAATASTTVSPARTSQDQTMTQAENAAAGAGASAVAQQNPPSAADPANPADPVTEVSA